MKPVAPEYMKVALLSKTIAVMIRAVIAIAISVVVSTSVPSLSWRAGLWGIVIAAVMLAATLEIMIAMRQVRALGYAELPDELAIRSGIMFQKLVFVPYGRMQQVNVQSGPLLRRWGLASVELVTAAATTNARIPGLKLAEAELLRAKLTELGHTQMEGL